MTETIMPDGGRLVHEEPVQAEWVDYNGHMNVAYYVLIFDHGTDAMFDLLGMDDDYRIKTDSSDFVVESHITYLDEVMEGDPMQVASLVMGFDNKRLHLFHHMYHATSGKLCATNEIMIVHVDMKSRRSAPFPENVVDNLQSYMDRQQPFSRPKQAGSVIGTKKG